MKTLFLGLLTLILLVHSGSAAAAADLSESEKNQLQEHAYLSKREMVNGAPWPKLTFYVLLNGTPEECMALFSDFERQKDYVPGLIKSVVIDQPSPTEVHTEYELRMPWPIPNSHYVHGTIVNQPSNDKFTIKWFVIKSDTTEKIEGGASFEAFGDTHTLMIYESLIYPKSVLAPLFASTMAEETKDGVLAIKSFIEEQVSEKNAAYDHSLSLLRASLSGEKVFVKKK